MEAEEQKEEWLKSLRKNGFDTLSAEFAADLICEAETEAHNRAVEACAEWLRTKRRVKHGGFDFPALGISMMCEALKREPKP